MLVAGVGVVLVTVVVVLFVCARTLTSHASCLDSGILHMPRGAWPHGPRGGVQVPRNRAGTSYMPRVCRWTSTHTRPMTLALRLQSDKFSEW